MKSGKIRKAQLNKKNKYMYVVLSLGRRGNYKNATVHSLIASAFIGPRPEGVDVMHKNGDRVDNRAENLAYGTRSENNHDKEKHGTDPQRNKTHCSRGHKLESPNLRVSLQKKGWRGCLSCNRASARMSKKPGSEADFQELSDSYYRLLMSEGD